MKNENTCPPQNVCTDIHSLTTHGNKTQKEKPKLSTLAKCSLFMQWSIVPFTERDEVLIIAQWERTLNMYYRPHTRCLW